MTRVSFFTFKCVKMLLTARGEEEAMTRVSNAPQWDAWVTISRRVSLWVGSPLGSRWHWGHDPGLHIVIYLVVWKMRFWKPGETRPWPGTPYLYVPCSVEDEVLKARWRRGHDPGPHIFIYLVVWKLRFWKPGEDEAMTRDPGLSSSLRPSVVSLYFTESLYLKRQDG